MVGGSSLPTTTRTAPLSTQQTHPLWSTLRSGVVLTPLKLLYVLSFWILGPLAHFITDITAQSGVFIVYTAYFAIALLGLLCEYWPRRDPAAEGVRRARRLLPIDPGMALVRGRGALEHCLRQAAHKLNLTIPASEAQPGIHDLLEALRPHMPSDLYQDANKLRRLANEAAHDPDWSVDGSTAHQSLQTAAKVRRWARTVK